MTSKFVAAVACWLLVACSGPVAALVPPTPTPVPIPTPTPTCGARVEQYRAGILPIFEQWDDAMKIAHRTARINLAPQIERLQEVRREMVALDHDPCFDEMHDAYLNGMKYDIDMFLAFMADLRGDQIEAQENSRIYWDNGMSMLKSFSTP